MPMYAYRFDGTDEIVEEFQHMSEEPLAEIGGRPVTRAVHAPNVRTNYGEGSGTDPVKMLSIALDNEDEIDDFRQRNPGVECSRDRRSPDFGVPIAASRSQKLRILNTEGFVETN